MLSTYAALEYLSALLGKIAHQQKRTNPDSDIKYLCIANNKASVMVGAFMSLLSMNDNRIAKEMLYEEFATGQRPAEQPILPYVTKMFASAK